MKNSLLALIVVLATCVLAIAQTTVVRDSIGKVKVTVTRDNKANTDNTAVIVIGVNITDVDSADVNANSSNASTTHGKTSFISDSDDSDFLFCSANAGGGILVAIVVIIAVFGFPVLILFVIFFFRYKNRKARYRPTEQAFATDQPPPAEFIHENKTVSSRSQGIKNTLTGIGLFTFLWAVTDEFGIGVTNLLVTFMGIGQWIIGSKQQTQDANATWMYTGNRDKRKDPDNARTDSPGITPSESEKKDKGVNEEENNENK